jgi:hypothetical protein
MVPRDTYLRFWSKGCILLNGAMLEVVNVCDKSSEKFRGNPLQDTLLAYPRQKYLVPKVQFLGISLCAVVMALNKAVPTSCVKARGDKLVKFN